VTPRHFKSGASAQPFREVVLGQALIAAPHAAVAARLRNPGERRGATVKKEDVDCPKYERRFHDLAKRRVFRAPGIPKGLQARSPADSDPARINVR
jgi:hypothetical protein